MSSNYLTLTNMVLRRLNEVEIQSADFGSVRGVQALAKDAVKNSVATINQAEFEWPFNAAEESGALVVGQTEYSWPASLKTVDWQSFQIQDDGGATSNEYRTLKFIDRDQWYQYMRDTDYEAGVSGIGMPKYVFPAHGTGFGVSPSPDKTYRIEFRYWLNYTDLSATSDVSRIPTAFDSLIVDGAMYHMYMFKDNPEAAQLAYQAFEMGLANMRSMYINHQDKVYDARVNFGGESIQSGSLVRLVERL